MVDLTHDHGTPWRQTVLEKGFNAEIDDGLIKDHFSEKLVDMGILQNHEWYYTQKDGVKEINIDRIFRQNRDIDIQEEAPWYVKIQFWTRSVYIAATRLLIILFGFTVLYQIFNAEIDLIEVVKDLYEITMEHGNIGYLAIATALYFLAKNIVLFINQSRPK